MIKQNDKLTERIIRCCYNVHNELGPGYNEKIYQNALKTELANKGIKYETEKVYKVYYQGKNVGNQV